MINGSKEITPKLVREQEKDNYDLCKLQDGEVAYKDIHRIEALARRSTKFFTREVFEKNILPLQSDGPVASNEYSDYDLWLQKKDFERRIRQDMLDQVLLDYEQLREKHMNERLKEARERKEGHQHWFQQKREDSLRRKQEAEMRRQIEMQKMDEKRH